MADLWATVVEASGELAWLSAGFLALALIVKRRRVLDERRATWPELRLNLVYYALDTLAVVPVVVLLVDAVHGAVAPLALLTPADLAGWPAWAVVLACIAVSDLVGYWRHRWMHGRVLWPVHAIHHSDTRMTWLALARFHPVNRLIAAGLNALVLALLGFPAAAIALNGLLRHHYGYFIHADLPWTYGPLDRVFVSPVLHRWHHVREGQGTASNFATIFALCDVIFGTWFQPARAVPALGITEPDFPGHWGGQMLFPFRVWAGRLVRKPAVS